MKFLDALLWPRPIIISALVATLVVPPHAIAQEENIVNDTRPAAVIEDPGPTVVRMVMPTEREGVTVNVEVAAVTPETDAAVVKYFSQRHTELTGGRDVPIDILEIGLVDDGKEAGLTALNENARLAVAAGAGPEGVQILEEIPGAPRSSALLSRELVEKSSFVRSFRSTAVANSDAKAARANYVFSIVIGGLVGGVTHATYATSDDLDPMGLMTIIGYVAGIEFGIQLGINSYVKWAKNGKLFGIQLPEKYNDFVLFAKRFGVSAFSNMGLVAILHHFGVHQGFTSWSTFFEILWPSFFFTAATTTWYASLDDIERNHGKDESKIANMVVPASLTLLGVALTAASLKKIMRFFTYGPIIGDFSTITWIGIGALGTQAVKLWEIGRNVIPKVLGKIAGRAQKAPACEVADGRSHWLRRRTLPAN